MKRVIPVILCGGSGTRLWPLSRVDTPKQFLKLLDNQTLLQKTVLRTLRITGAAEDEIVVVTLSSMVPETLRQLEEISPRLTTHVLGEPQARNTAAAVAYAAQYVRDQFGEDSLVWILPSDHYVGDEKALATALEEAIRVAGNDYLVTFGIQPTRPETGYGYIRQADPIDGSAACRVEKFIEKPQRDVAIRFLEMGGYLWSSGMHVFSIPTVTENYEEHAPVIWQTVRRSLQESLSPLKPASFVYGQVREEPFETAVMEKARKIAVIPCDPQWSDIGSWESLWEIRPKNEDGNALKGRVVCEETENSIILANNRLVTCVGLKDIVIVETADSILVADKKCNHSLKKLVKALQQGGHQETVSSAAS